MPFASSFAVDKNNVDQTISGLTATVLTADNVLWDFNGDFDIATGDFIVPIDGIYSFDVQCRVKNLLNVTASEITLFRRGTGIGGVDEFWFTLGKMYANLVDAEMHFSANTRFDMRLGERYCIKISLFGVSPSLKISGDDTLTSWGFNYESDLAGNP